jgi:hypothetical protein
MISSGNLDARDSWLWERAVAHGIRRVVSSHKVDKLGKHTVNIWMVTPLPC